MTKLETRLEDDLRWMQYALSLAKRAESEGEVPVGAVIVQNGQVAGKGWNQNIGGNDPSAHAEIVALRDAGRRLRNYRLPQCVMYVTLEPCAMCVGAMIHARLEQLVFGAADPKTGALGGAYDLPMVHPHNHELAYRGGVLSDEVSGMLKAFFKARR